MSIYTIHQAARALLPIIRLDPEFAEATIADLEQKAATAYREYASGEYQDRERHIEFLYRAEGAVVEVRDRGPFRENGVRNHPTPTVEDGVVSLRIDFVYVEAPTFWTTAEAVAEFERRLPDWLIAEYGPTASYGGPGFTFRTTAVAGSIRARVIEWFNRNIYSLLSGLQLDMPTEESGGFLDNYYIDDRVRGAERFTREFRDNARTMLGRSRAQSMAQEVKRHDSSDALYKFLDSSERRTFEAADLLSIEMAPHGTLSSRTWGIEVESGGARGANTPKGWDAKGDGSLRSAYAEQDAAAQITDGGHWEACECGDDECEDRDWIPGTNDEPAPYVDRSQDCREFVSPILHSVHSKGLEELTSYLSTQPQNASAGIHVHVGASDLTPKQIGGLVFAYNLLEPMLAPLYRRERRNYCQARDASAVIQVMRAAKTAKSNREMGRIGERYTTVNLWALQSHTTVEFRAMGPVYDYEYLIRWAYFVREMVNAAKADVPVKRWTKARSLQDVLAIFMEYGKETSPEMVASLQDTEEVRDTLNIRGTVRELIGV